MKNVRTWTRLSLLVLAAAAGFFLPAGAAHAKCYGITDPIAPPVAPGHVCGTVGKLGHNGSQYVQRAAGSTYVKLCPAGSSSSSSSCSTTFQLCGAGSSSRA